MRPAYSAAAVVLSLVAAVVGVSTSGCRVDGCRGGTSAELLNATSSRLIVVAADPNGFGQDGASDTTTSVSSGETSTVGSHSNWGGTGCIALPPADELRVRRDEGTTITTIRQDDGRWTVVKNGCPRRGCGVRVFRLSLTDADVPL